MTIKGATNAPQFAEPIGLLNEVERLRGELEKVTEQLRLEREAREKAEALCAIYEDMWIQHVCYGGIKNDGCRY